MHGNEARLFQEKTGSMKMKGFLLKICTIIISNLTVLFCGILLNLGFWQYAQCAPKYQISGYYLGATSEELGIEVEIDPLVEEKYYDVEINNVLLFFVKVQDTLRLYRIVQEQGIGSNKVYDVLGNLKSKYGTPDKQYIKTGGVRPRNKANYTTTVKNKAIWNISETQKFIAEIEGRRVVYELLDHDPEKIGPPQKVEASEDGEFSGGGWNPDY